MEVSLETLKHLAVYASPPLVGALGLDLAGLLAGVIVSVVVYAKPHLAAPLTVRPPLPVYEPPVAPETVAAEPCRNAIHAYTRWLTECKGNCLAACSYYAPDARIPCVLLGVVRSSFPASDPFTQSIESLVAEVQLLLAEVRQNNVLRQHEEVRATPWFKYLMLLLTVPFQAAIYFGVLQILAVVASQL